MSSMVEEVYKKEHFVMTRCYGILYHGCHLGLYWDMSCMKTFKWASKEGVA